MSNLNLAALSGNVCITLTQSDLKEFARNIVSDAIDNYRKEISANPEEVFYTIKQVATTLSVDRTTLYNWEKRGYLTPHRVGGLVRYSKSDIDAIITKRGAK
ncbi:MAG: helix-turn-helix domain-containing protein [Rikenellaceae bacterium]